MITWSEPATRYIGPPVCKSGIVVRVIRPAAGWIRTRTPTPRPNSSQPAVAPSNGWPNRVTETGGANGSTVTGTDVLGAAGDTEADVDGAVVTRAAVGGPRRTWFKAATPATTTARATASVNHLGQGSRGGADSAGSESTSNQSMSSECASSRPTPHCEPARRSAASISKAGSTRISDGLRPSSRLPSSRRPSWRAPSWRRPSWPAPSSRPPCGSPSWPARAPAGRPAARTPARR